MNEPGKSDKPVVPGMSANMNYWDIHRWWMESMEVRGSAEENGEDIERARLDDVLSHVGPAKQVDRTQSRLGAGTAHPEDLHSALDRVRKAALEDKGLKFTSLWHHVYNGQKRLPWMNRAMINSA